MSREKTRLREFLESNPKWIGVLFTGLMLLSQAGAAAAGGGVSTTGP
jgi:hypothetical protein